MPDPSPLSAEAFIEHWSKAETNERANSQSFLIGLAQLLGVPAPTHSHASGYSFEFPVKVPGADSTNFIDLYRRAHFVLESKQFAARREELTALERAAISSGAVPAKKKSGTERYVRYLPLRNEDRTSTDEVRRTALAGCYGKAPSVSRFVACAA